MKVLVTGAAGFIGSHTCEALINQGFSVAGLDNFDDFYSKKIKEKNLEKLTQNSLFNFYYGDIRNSNLINDVFNSYKPEIVIHLAAKAGVRPSIVQPELYYDVNVNGTLQILNVMIKNNVKKLIFASSSSVYGNNNKIPFSEDDNTEHPISPYAAAKKAGELLCFTYHHMYNIDVTCLRLFTVYGPRQRPDLAIHNFTNMILENSPIHIFGDGETKRDFTYIDDIINGIKKAIDKLYGYSIYNLGGHKTISINQIIQLLENLLQKKAHVKKLPKQLGDVEITFADISKAKRELDYSPIWNYEEGLKEFIQWKFRTKDSK